MPLMNFYAISLSPSLPHAHWPRENARVVVCVSVCCSCSSAFFSLLLFIIFLCIYFFFFLIEKKLLRAARALFSPHLGPKLTIRISALHIYFVVFYLFFLFAFARVVACLYLYIGWG